MVAAVLIAAFVVSAAFIANSLNHPQPAVRLAAAGNTNQGMGQPAVALVAPAAAPAVAAESFTCGSSAITNAKAPLVAQIDGIRTGRHAGYDRLTVEFSGTQPAAIDLRPQTGDTFVRSPRGDSVSLAGRDGLLILIRGAGAHTAYSGSLDIVTGHAGLAEVRVLEDFEGQVQIGLGLTGPACYHASIFSNPTRLVVDVQTS